MQLTLFFLLALAVAKGNSAYFINTENGNTSLNYRLPNETCPEHYEINIATKFHEGEKTFQGKVIIDIAVLNSTKRIIINALQLNISKITIENTCTRQAEELEYEYEGEREFLKLTRLNGKRFPALTKWKLNIDYSGVVSDNQEGIWSFEYTSGEEGEKRHYLGTNFGNVNARRAFPCYDEPGKLASFTITLYHSANYTAISNMPVNKALCREGKTVFLTTPRISINKVAFVVADLVYAEENTNGIRQRVYYRRGMDHNVQQSLSYGATILKYIHEYTDAKVMFPKLDYVVIPRKLANRAASFGLITYPEFFAKYNADNSTTTNQIWNSYKLALLISKEWFGSYVSIQWYSDLWLESSLAKVLTYKALIKNFPQWRILDFVGRGDEYDSEYQNDNEVLDSDSSDSTGPSEFYAPAKPSEIRNWMKNVSFNISSAVVFMWANALTDEVFRKAIQHFLKYNQHSTVVPEDFFAAIQLAAQELQYELPAPIGQMMSTWKDVDDLPLLTVTRNYTTGSFYVDQEPFRGKTLYVPINYAIASNPDFDDTKATDYLLNVTKMEVNATISEQEWLLVDKLSVGYYRIRYDDTNYELLTKSLRTGTPFKIPGKNRALLLADIYFLFYYGYLSQYTVLNLLTYIKHEDEYLPWTQASRIFRFYQLRLSDDNDYKCFATQLLSPIFAKTGVNDISGNNYYDQRLRAEIISTACLVGVKECLVQANNKLKAVLNGTVAIEPYLKDEIFCNGLRQSGDEEFYLLYKNLTKNKDSHEREKLISFLLCSGKKTHIMDLISASSDYSNELKTKDRLNLIQNVCSKSNIAALACIKSLRKNLKAYGHLRYEGNDSKLLYNIAHSISVSFIDGEVRQELLNLLTAANQKKLLDFDLDTLKQKIVKSFEDNEKFKRLLQLGIKYFVSHENCPSTVI